MRAWLARLHEGARLRLDQARNRREDADPVAVHLAWWVFRATRPFRQRG